MKKSGRMLALVLSLLLLATSFAGCGGNKQQAANADQKAAGQQASTSSGDQANTLPIVKSPLTLSIFWDMDAKATATMKSYAEIGMFREMEKRTGIKIDWKHPATGQGKEQFNLMLASRDMADMIYWDWRNNVTGGPGKAIQDGNIVKLNDLIDKNCPNFKKVFNDNPEWKKQSILDDGSYYMFPFIREEKLLRLSSAFQIRQDWLDKLGLKVPTTIDEWYTVLKAFKEKDPNGNGKQDEIPFVSIGAGATFGTTTPTIRAFEFAYGIIHGFYLNSGKVDYGPIQAAYKDYLITMNKWYKEGLIDNEYLATDLKSFTTKVSTHQAGAYHGMVSGYMGMFTDLVRPNYPNFKMTGVPFPKGPAGKSYGTLDFNSPGGGMAITTTNKHQVEAARWLDYLYSPEGKMLSNFGIENESYTMVNGEPKYTDKVLKNKEVPSVPSALIRYAMSISSGPFIQDKRYLPQILVYPEQNEAVQTWINSSDPSLLMPPVTPTQDESQKLSSIMNEINTYTDEMFNKFIMGLEPIDNYDKYVQRVKGLGIDNAIKIQQAALDRYNNRK